MKTSESKPLMTYRYPGNHKIGTRFKDGIIWEKSRSNLFTDWMVLRYGDGVSNDTGLRLGTWEPRIEKEAGNAQAVTTARAKVPRAIARGGITCSSEETSVMEAERRGDLNRWKTLAN